jgi:hypothetical protein
MNVVQFRALACLEGCENREVISAGEIGGASAKFTEISTKGGLHFEIVID